MGTRVNNNLIDKHLSTMLFSNYTFPNYHALTTRAASSPIHIGTQKTRTSVK